MASPAPPASLYCEGDLMAQVRHEAADAPHHTQSMPPTRSIQAGASSPRTSPSCQGKAYRVRQALRDRRSEIAATSARIASTSTKIASTATPVSTAPPLSPATPSIATPPIASASAGVSPPVAQTSIPSTTLANSRFVEKDGQKDRGANRKNKGNRRVGCGYNVADWLCEIIAGQLLWIVGQGLDERGIDISLEERQPVDIER